MVFRPAVEPGGPAAGSNLRGTSGSSSSSSTCASNNNSNAASRTLAAKTEQPRVKTELAHGLSGKSVQIKSSTRASAPSLVKAMPGSVAPGGPSSVSSDTQPRPSIPTKRSLPSADQENSQPQDDHVDVKPRIERGLSATELETAALPRVPSPSKRSRPSLDSGYGMGDQSLDQAHSQHQSGEGDASFGNATRPGPAVDDIVVAIPDSDDETLHDLANGIELQHASNASSSRSSTSASVHKQPAVAQSSSGTFSGSSKLNDLSPAARAESLLQRSRQCAEALEALINLVASGSADSIDIETWNFRLELCKKQVQKARAAIVGPSSPLQLKWDKRVEILAEMLEIKADSKSLSSAGNDEGELLNALNYNMDCIRRLEPSPAVATPLSGSRPPLMAQAVQSRPAILPANDAPVVGTPTMESVTPHHDRRESRFFVSAKAARLDTPVIEDVTRQDTVPAADFSKTQRMAVEGPEELLDDLNFDESIQLLSEDHVTVTRPAPPAFLPPAAVRPSHHRGPGPVQSTSGFRPAGAGAGNPAASKPATSGNKAPGPAQVAAAPPSVNSPFAACSARAPTVNNVAKGKGRVDVSAAELDDLMDGCELFVDEEEEVEIVDAQPRRQQASATTRPAEANAGRDNSTADGPPRAVGLGGAMDVARAISKPTFRHPWSRDVDKALRQRFGLSGFRQNQEEAINATLGGRDVFVLLPTGGGKSLCFQLPAVVQSGKTKGVSIVVSPLLSLISDQTNALKEKDIPVIYINSKMTQTQRNFAFDRLDAEPPEVCMAYVTPELIMNSSKFQNTMQRLQRRGQLARFVIDEAHCVSSWGHDFRPDYKQLSCLKQQYPEVPIIALTATANHRVKEDIVKTLKMRSPLVLTASFNRMNLRYEVRPKTKSVEQDIAMLINSEFRGQSGIIYCNSQKKCEDVAKALREKYRIKARHYHAAVPENDKDRIQKAWQSGSVDVIVATIAFGMGIDKPDVRFVIHHSFSQSIEAYYQETGRAGRDGKPSSCVLFFSYNDGRILQRLIDAGPGTHEQKDSQRANVQRVVQYCMNEIDCRRVQVLQYFGDTDFRKEDCRQTCDNCSRTQKLVRQDVTELAKEAVKLVKAVQNDNVTVLHAVDIFRGSKVKKITDKGQDQIEQFGKGSTLNRGDVARLFQLLICECALGERIEGNRAGYYNSYVELGPHAQAFLGGRRKLEMAVSPDGAKSDAPSRAPRAKRVRGMSRAQKEAVVTAPETDEDDDWVPPEDPEDCIEDAVSQEKRPRASASRTAGGGGGGAGRSDSSTDAVIAKLMALRYETAETEGCNELDIISDEGIFAIAAALPQTLRECRRLLPSEAEGVDWWSDSGGKAVCEQARAERDAGKNTVGSSASSSRAPLSMAGAAAMSRAQTALAPARASMPGSASARTSSTGAAKKPLNLTQFQYKPSSGSGAGGSGGGGGGSASRPAKQSKSTGGGSGVGAGGVRPMPVTKRR